VKTPRAQDPGERTRRTRYVLRHWILDSVPVVLVLVVWFAWDYRLTVPEILSWRFVVLVAIGLVVVALVGYIMGRLFWKHGLAPDDE
jgi:uncharacterized membrane protein